MQPNTSLAPPASGDNPDRQLVGRVLYLASLASRRRDIDSMMDTLRAVTAHWHEPDPLSPNDQAALRQLEANLKRYLVTTDPLRTFTLETLEQRIKGQSGLGTQSSTTWRSLVGVVLASLAASGLAFLTPVPFESRLLLSVPLFFVVLHISIAWFYLTALRNFNQSLRHAFVYFAAGIMLFSLAFSHYVVLYLLGLDTHPVLRYGGITWLFSVPFMLMFVGLRMYARLLGIASRLIPLWVVPTGAIIAAAILLFVPHGPVHNQTYFHIWSIGAAMIPIFALPSSILARKIQKTVTDAYAKPMRWLYYYTLVVGLGSVVAVGAVFWLGELYGGPLALVTAGCGIIPQLVLLYTGYSFKKETGR
jgi:hypothetical protein